LRFASCSNSRRLPPDDLEIEGVGVLERRGPEAPSQLVLEEFEHGGRQRVDVSPFRTSRPSRQG
jgi:hypothetical protein